MTTNDNNEATTFDHFQAVKDFYEAAGVDPSRELALDLIREESREVFEAAENLLKELCDLEYVVIGATIHGHHVEMPADVSEAISRVAHLFDLIHPAILSEAFRRVHESNMSKRVDGKLVRDEITGKVLKSDNYQKPDLSDLI